MKNIFLPSSKELDAQIKTIEEKLLYIPKGEFYVAKNGKYTRWRTGGGLTVSKKKRDYAKKLCARKYYEAKMGYLKKLKRAALAYEFAARSDEKITLDELHNDEGYATLLNEYFNGNFEIANDAWSKKNYDSNKLFIEEKKFHTISGVMVRSKSEMAIADALTRHGIPFRYEYPLELDGHRIFPDFTILSPRTHKEIIWEHFGMMDDAKYRSGVWGKLEELASHGYLMGVDFVYTLESREHPLDDLAIEAVIREYFL